MIAKKKGGKIGKNFSRKQTDIYINGISDLLFKLTQVNWVTRLKFAIVFTMSLLIPFGWFWQIAVKNICLNLIKKGGNHVSRK